MNLITTFKQANYDQTQLKQIVTQTTYKQRSKSTC